MPYTVSLLVFDGYKSSFPRFPRNSRNYSFNVFITEIYDRISDCKGSTPQNMTFVMFETVRAVFSEHVVFGKIRNVTYSRYVRKCTFQLFRVNKTKIISVLCNKILRGVKFYGRKKRKYYLCTWTKLLRIFHAFSLAQIDDIVNNLGFGLLSDRFVVCEECIADIFVP